MILLKLCTDSITKNEIQLKHFPGIFLKFQEILFWCDFLKTEEFFSRAAEGNVEQDSVEIFSSYHIIASNIRIP